LARALFPALPPARPAAASPCLFRKDRFQIRDALPLFLPSDPLPYRR
jgi:hypothetical protein